VEFIKNILSTHTDRFIRELESQGFHHDQAATFLSQLDQHFTLSSQSFDLTLAIQLLLSDDPAKIIYAIDINTLAQKSAVPPIIAQIGLESLQRDLRSLLWEKRTEIVDTVSLLAWGPQGYPSSLTQKIFN
jgi:hypothetical protein